MSLAAIQRAAMRRQFALLIGGALALGIAEISCSGGGGTAPNIAPVVPSAMFIVSGDAQQATVGTELVSAVVVKVNDAAGKSVKNQLVNFRVVAGGGSVFAGAGLTNDAGEARERWTLGTTAADTQRLEARAVDAATGSALVFATFRATAVAATASKLKRVSVDGGQATVGAAVTSTPSVSVVDQFDNPVSGAAVVFAVASGGGGVTSANQTSAASGLATVGSWTLGTTAGLNTLTATSTGLTGSPMTFTATGTVGASIQLVLTTSAAGAASGAAFTTQPIIAVRDAAGNTVTTDNSTVVTMTVSAGATVLGTAMATTSSGMATFTIVGISGTVGTSYTLTFSKSGLTSAAQSITSAVGAASQLVLATTAAGAASGSKFTTQPVVAVRDAAGNMVTTDNSTVVTMTASTGATVVGTATATASGGVATFATIGISGTAGTSYTLTFSKSGLTSAAQNITVAVGTASQLILTTNAAGAISGSAFATQPVLSVRDAAGNTVTTDNTTVMTLTVSAGATVVGSSTATASSGIATFASVGISAVGTFTLTFAASGLTTANQTISSTAASNTQLVLTTAAVGAASGAAFTTQPVVAIRDLAGNTLTTDNGSLVTVTVSAGATVVGNTTTQALNGVATFTNVGVSGTAGTSYTLTFSRSGLPSVTQSISPTAGTASQLVLTTNGAGAASGMGFTTQPVVAIRDAAGNTRPTDNSSVVSMTVSSGATVVGSASATASSGVATFSTVGVSGTAGTNYTLTFAATGLTSAAQSIVPTAGAVATVTVSPNTFSLFVLLARQFTADLRDASGNTVSGATVTWSSSNTAVATVSASGLVTGVAAGTATLTATSNGKTGTATITVLASTALTAGGNFTCGLTSAGAASCWGNNSFGQLGDGTMTGRLTPVAVQGGLVFTALTGGEFHACGLTSAGAAYCWGSNGHFELGNGTATQPGLAAPVAVQGGLVFTALAPGMLHTCGLTSAGAAYCWGNGDFRQLGDGILTPHNQIAPRAVEGGLVFTALTANNSHTCGLTSAGAAYCWGDNTDGDLGSTTSHAGVPGPVDGGLVFTALTAGSHSTCGLTSAGAAYCWGNNFNGALGDGTTTNRATPVAVQGGLVFMALTAGWNHTCGLTSAGAVYCWGTNTEGQLGDGTTTYHLTPAAVQGGLVFAALIAGNYHTCALTSAGAAYCWGYNRTGQLGDGTTTSRLSPVPVIRP